MAHFEEELVAYLNGVTAVTNLIGTSNIMPWPLDQNPTLPALTYFRVAADRVRSLSGNSGLAAADFQIDAWGRTRLETWNVAEAVREALDGYKGDMGTLEVGNIMVTNESDMFEEEDEVFRRMLTIEVWYCENQVNNIQP
jgi:hypothetical protein